VRSNRVMPCAPPSGVISQAEGRAEAATPPLPPVGVRGVGGEQLSGRPPPAHMLRQPQRGARGGAAAGQRPGIAGRQGSGWAAGGTARYCARLWGARHRRCSKTPGSGRGRFPRRAPGHACMRPDMQCIFTHTCTRRLHTCRNRTRAQAMRRHFLLAPRLLSRAALWARGSGARARACGPAWPRPRGASRACWCAAACCAVCCVFVLRMVQKAMCAACCSSWCVACVCAGRRATLAWRPACAHARTRPGQRAAAWPASVGAASLGAPGQPWGCPGGFFPSGLKIQ
jgi:hypothetical protein